MIRFATFAALAALLSLSTSIAAQSDCDTYGCKSYAYIWEVSGLGMVITQTEENEDGLCECIGTWCIQETGCTASYTVTITAPGPGQNVCYSRNIEDVLSVLCSPDETPCQKTVKVGPPWQTTVDCGTSESRFYQTKAGICWQAEPTGNAWAEFGCYDCEFNC